MTVARFRVTEPKRPAGMTVFNTNKVDTTKQKMFFGAPLGVQRYDQFKYPVFDKLTQTQLVIFGDQRRCHYKKIVQTIKHFVPSKSTFSLPTLSTRSSWILYKGVVLGWLLVLSVHYLNLKVP